MKIFVAGATGRVAEYLMKDLLEKGYELVAGARNPERVLEKSKVTAVKLDLKAPIADLVNLLEGVDAIYFTAGSRGKDLLQTDAFGAVKLMQAAEKAGVKRFILLSSLNATKPENWSWYEEAGLMDYIIAKYFADNYLIHQTHLDYTVLQPTVLVESDEVTGKINIDIAGAGSNSIPNVALTLAEILEHNNTIGKVITMSDGDTDISDALDKVGTVHD